MDCVDCDKCRLWGKLQTHGMGTALKILFSDLPHSYYQSADGTVQIPFQLTRFVSFFVFINIIFISEKIFLVQYYLF